MGLSSWKLVFELRIFLHGLDIENICPVRPKRISPICVMKKSVVHWETRSCINKTCNMFRKYFMKI